MLECDKLDRVPLRVCVDERLPYRKLAEQLYVRRRLRNVGFWKPLQSWLPGSDLAARISPRTNARVVFCLAGAPPPVHHAGVDVCVCVCLGPS